MGLGVVIMGMTFASMGLVSDMIWSTLINEAEIGWD